MTSGLVPSQLPNGARRHRVVAIVVGVLIALGAGFVATSLAGGARVAWHAITLMDPRWLVAALGCEMAAYLMLSCQVRYMAGAPTQVKRAAPIRTALVLFGLGSVLPAAPLEGFAMTGAALTRRRLDRERIVLLLGFTQWFSVGGILALAAVNGLVAVGLSHVPDPYVGVTALSAIGILAVLAATSWLAMRRQAAELIALVGLRLRYWRQCPAPMERRARGAAWHAAAMHVVGRRIDRVVLLGTSVAAWSADGFCLYFALRAAGVDVGIDVLFLAYTIGIVASWVPLVPAGIGVVETVTPLILHAYGVPLPTALAAVLGFRLLATVLPALAGVVALAGLRVGRGPAPVTT
jgi:uncharacterized protein (TIRG00374 family)